MKTTPSISQIFKFYACACAQNKTFFEKLAVFDFNFFMFNRVELTWTLLNSLVWHLKYWLGLFSYWPHPFPGGHALFWNWKIAFFEKLPEFDFNFYILTWVELTWSILNSHVWHLDYWFFLFSCWPRPFPGGHALFWNLKNCLFLNCLSSTSIFVMLKGVELTLIILSSHVWHLKYCFFCFLIRHTLSFGCHALFKIEKRLLF